MARKGYKITPAVRARLAKARAAIKPKPRNTNRKKNGYKHKIHAKKFRKDHKAYRNKCRKENYAKTRPKVRKNRPWGGNEEAFIMETPNFKSYPDSRVARILDRSVQAIQQKRYMLKNKS